MPEYRIDLSWRRNGGPFERGNYRHDHTVRFNGGQELRNSAASEYGGDDAASNPEELLVAALSSCQMLTFLAVAANRGYLVDSYEDHAVATLGKNADGKIAVTRAVLSPRVRIGGDKQPSAEDLRNMHERAHAACFIANSLRTEVSLNL